MIPRDAPWIGRLLLGLAVVSPIAVAHRFRHDGWSWQQAAEELGQPELVECLRRYQEERVPAHPVPASPGREEPAASGRE